ncbi:unnamed protein product [Meloidogyne enterolobii]|uniref:Uncharacterized protein n=1 Tax=Meloidogyne enterolobii TaxID=390850 RepID=A0ACB0Z9L2_MELEN
MLISILVTLERKINLFFVDELIEYCNRENLVKSTKKKNDLSVQKSPHKMSAKTGLG